MIKHLLSCLYTVCESHTHAYDPMYQLNRLWMFYFAYVLLFIESNRIYSSMCVFELCLKMDAYVRIFLSWISCDN